MPNPNNPTFAEAGRSWISSLESVNGRGKKRAPNTVRVYKLSAERAIEALGDLKLPIKNRALQQYVATMNCFSLAQVRLDLTVIKLIVESVQDDDLNPLFPLRIKYDEIGAPAIDPEDQDAPCATDEQTTIALADAQLRLPVLFAAGLGLRISEILALYYGALDDKADFYDPQAAVVHIGRTLKTKNSRRTIPVPMALNSFLAKEFSDRRTGDRLFDRTVSGVYRNLRVVGLVGLGMHAFRRAFATSMDKAKLSPVALKRIMGHSKGGDITARYSRAGDDLEFLRAEMEKAFSLPLPVSTEVAA